MKDVSRLNPVGTKGDCEQWQNSEFILKVKSIYILTGWT